MRTRDYFSLAFSGLREKKSRALGAALGITIAVIALSAALGIGESFRYWFVESFERVFQANLVYMFKAGGFTESDLAFVRQIPGVVDVIGVTWARCEVLVEGKHVWVNLLAVPRDKLYRYYGVADPSEIVEEGSLEVKDVAVLLGGHVWKEWSTNKRLFEVGQTIPVKVFTRKGTVNLNLIVTGLLKSRSMTSVGANPDYSVIMDSESFFRLVEGERKYLVIMVYFSSSKEAEKKINMLAAIFPDAEVFAAKYAMEQITTFIMALQVFFGLISGVSILITALWIFDTMTISVIQRTKEIGILKAVGFKNRDVALIFVLEALILTLVGVSVGLCISTALSRVVRIEFFTLHMGIMLTPEAYVVTAAVPLLSNLLAAYLPARRAAGIDPVRALRYE